MFPEHVGLTDLLWTLCKFVKGGYTSGCTSKPAI